MIHLSDNDYDLGRQAYSEMYYRFNNVGYGTGDENSGILITLWPISEDAITFAKGSAAEKLTDVNEDRIEEKCAAVLSESGKEYDAAMRFLVFNFCFRKPLPKFKLCAYDNFCHKQTRRHYENISEWRY